MPVKKRRTALKAILLAPVAPIEVWGVQELLAGDAVAGAVAILLGMSMVSVYVVVQEYDLPYEDEILAVVADGVTNETTEVVEDTVKNVAERAQDEADGRTDSTDG